MLESLKSDGKLKDNAVTANVIAPNAITNAAIASDAVNAASIADGSITNALLADGTVQEQKLSSSVQTKLNQTAPVTSVAGKTGVVTLVKGDVGLGNADNTSDMNKPVSTAQREAINARLGLTSAALTGARRAPAVAESGKTTLGVGSANVTTDLDAFLTASQQTAISTYMTFMLDNGNFNLALSDIAAVNERFGTVVPLEIAWSHPGSTNLAGIAAGNDDAYIIARAKQLQDYGGPVFLRWNWEMNGDWYPWSAFQVNGTPIAGDAPSDYVAAWRRVYSIVSQIAPNASFVWCPHLWEYLRRHLRNGTRATNTSIGWA